MALFKEHRGGGSDPKQIEVNSLDDIKSFYNGTFSEPFTENMKCDDPINTDDPNWKTRWLVIGESKEYGSCVLGYTNKELK